MFSLEPACGMIVPPPQDSAAAGHSQLRSAQQLPPRQQVSRGGSWGQAVVRPQLHGCLPFLAAPLATRDSSAAAA
eukprot:7720885-Alexandrium_andersonii.AAC.1